MPGEIFLDIDYAGTVKRILVVDIEEIVPVGGI